MRPQLAEYRQTEAHTHIEGLHDSIEIAMLMQMQMVIVVCV
jgi:hypothetical protein